MIKVIEHRKLNVIFEDVTNDKTEALFTHRHIFQTLHSLDSTGYM